jgi:hypothetical protein
VQPLATFIFREERGKWKEIEKCIDLWIDLIEPQWRVSISGCQGSEGPDTHGQHHQNCTGWPCFLSSRKAKKTKKDCSRVKNWKTNSQSVYYHTHCSPAALLRLLPCMNHLGSCGSAERPKSLHF